MTHQAFSSLRFFLRWRDSRQDRSTGMSKPCSVCNSPDAPAIAKAVRSGTPGTITASLYGISTSALSRHRDHIPTTDASITGTPHADAAEAVIEAVRVLNKGEISQIDEAEVQQFK